MGTRLTIVVGITGGIAAYKAVGVIRSFVLEGHSVHVVATEAALRFVGRPTLEAISRNPVATDLYDGVAEVRHVALGQSADLIVIAPATANTIAKLAAGLADDLLGNTVLASSAPLVIAPAMHTEMWTNAATAANVATLRSRGVTVVGPAVGQLTGQDSGAGRMEEPATIAAAALAAVDGSSGVESPALPEPSVNRDLSGRRVVITAGGTREPLDPVRFIGNRSTGRQGVALAQAARDRGADVTLIAANLEVEPPDGVRVVNAPTARELEKRVAKAAKSADVVVMTAAVSDYRPADVQESKMKRDLDGAPLVLELVQNPDILAELSRSKSEGQVVIGFAAETESDPERLLALGRDKLARKGCDYLVVNAVGWNHGFAGDENSVVVLKTGGDIMFEASGTKLSVADRILDLLT